MTALVEIYFPTERGNQRLQVPLGSDSDRISRVSCIFEIIVEDAVRCTLRNKLSAHCIYSGNQGGTAEVLRLLSLF